MITNKQLTELVKAEISFLASEIFTFAGCTVAEDEATKPETYRWIRDESVQVRTDRLYWLARKFPQEYRKCTWEMGKLRPQRPENGPAKKRSRNIRSTFS